MDRGSQLSQDDEDDKDDKDDKEDEEEEEERRTRQEEAEEKEEATDIKSNNPHLAGGETTKISYSPSGFENWGIWGHFQDWTIPVPRMKLQLRRMQVRKLGPSSNFPEISIDIHRYHGEGKLYGYGRLWKMG